MTFLKKSLALCIFIDLEIKIAGKAYFIDLEIKIAGKA